MTPAFESALREEAEVVITTYDANGRPGSVPIWFACVVWKVYMVTGRESLKVRKLRINPRVCLSFPGRKSISLDGAGRLCSEEALVCRVAPLLNREYEGAWGHDAHMVQRLLSGDAVLLEVTPS